MLVDIIGPIKLVRAQGKAAYPYCHCLFIDDRVKAVVDTGAGVRSFAALDTATVEMVLYTHYHPDHTHGHEQFAQARSFIHPLDLPAMESVEAYHYFNGAHLWQELMGVPRHELAERVRRERPDPDFPDVSPRVKPIDGTLQEGEVIDFGTTSATVMHTPGHTPGHCVYFFEREGLLFSGDIDLIDFGPWYGSYLSNLDDFIASIRRIRELRPRILVSCHRRLLTEGIEEACDAFLSKICQREERLLAALQVPRSLDELARLGIVHPDLPDPFHEFWEKMMLTKHLERLERQHRVEREDGRFRLLA
ncbi:MAG: MBL fold metallo-hydrolase [Syntrophomonadaceae bacterium]|nr:MBL fold metallo-hydrolase [Syntrophomonadaceae bacterium]MDH7496934.1 MBL fold metallo-hydrolase [Syntrophomonadaceae bacterium]